MASTVFASKLQGLRKEKAVTQEQLAAHLGVSPQAVSKWENGSYPDGDLLPKIADFFAVSIDYLYGMAERSPSPEQAMIDCMHELLTSCEDNINNGEYFEKLMKFCWAGQVGAWADNKYYYDPVAINEINSTTASNICNNAGFSFMRLGPDYRFYFLAPRPEKGYGGCIAPSEKLCGLFRFLSDICNLKVLYFLSTLRPEQFVKASTVGERLGLPTEKVNSALEYLDGFSNKFLTCCVVTDAEGVSEKVYQLNPLKSQLFIMLMIAAAAVLDQPRSYNMQIGMADEGLISEKELDFIKTKGEKNGKEK